MADGESCESGNSICHLAGVEMFSVEYDRRIIGLLYELYVISSSGGDLLYSLVDHALTYDRIVGCMHDNSRGLGEMYVHLFLDLM